jgi:hypothetical protein
LKGRENRNHKPCHSNLRSPPAPYVQFVLNPLNLLFGEIYSPTAVRTSTERRKVRLHARICALRAFSEDFRLRRFIQLPLKFFATFLTRTMQARVRVIARGFQRMVVNGCPFLAVQAHVPPENIVVCNSNKHVTVLRVTDAVQAHVIASALPTGYCALIFDANRGYDLSNLKDGVRGKYIARYRAGTNLVLLSPDVAKHFSDKQAVNMTLRSLIRRSKGPFRRAR